MHLLCMKCMNSFILCVDHCGNQKTCSDCIASPDCGWCKDGVSVLFYMTVSVNWFQVACSVNVKREIKLTNQNCHTLWCRRFWFGQLDFLFYIHGTSNLKSKVIAHRGERLHVAAFTTCVTWCVLLQNFREMFSNATTGRGPQFCGTVSDLMATGCRQSDIVDPRSQLRSNTSVNSIQTII